MQYMLDTNICISAITYAELAYGVEESRMSYGGGEGEEHSKVISGIGEKYIGCYQLRIG